MNDNGDLDPLYKSLDEDIPQIRVLYVRPLQPQEHEDAVVRCILVTVALHAIKDRYVALSYTWGDPNNKRTILINGHRHLVTVNLEAFLQQWRRHAKVNSAWTFLNSYVWVDAVCINQVCATVYSICIK
jgi:hypothetical protein